MDHPLVLSLFPGIGLLDMAFDFLADAPFTEMGKRRAIANAVPLPMGLAIAGAVKRAMGYPTSEEAA